MNVKKVQKLAFLLYSLEGGGAERVATILANHFAKDCLIHVILFNQPIAYSLPKNVHVKILRKRYSQRWIRLLTLIFLPFKLFRYIEQHNINTLLSFDTLPNSLNCSLRWFGGTYNIWLRVGSYTSIQYERKRFSGYFHHFLIKKLYPKADKIFVNAQRIGNDLQNRFGIKLPILLFPNPIDLNKINAQKLIPPSIFHDYIFIHVAGFRPEKNHQLLIDAFEKIRHLPVQLWLVGRGELEQIIKEKVVKLGLSKQVKFFGFQPNPFPFMFSADCMVLSSNFEGFPNVLLEGLACGLPIISTDCPSGPREILAPDTNCDNTTLDEIEIVKYGLLTPVGNAKLLAESMERVYRDSSFQQPIKYKKRAKDFDVNSILEFMKEQLLKSNEHAKIF